MSQPTSSINTAAGPNKTLAEVSLSNDALYAASLTADATYTTTPNAANLAAARAAFAKAIQATL